MKLPIDITPQDYANGVPHSADRCAIALAASRQWGGTWRVTGNGLVQRSGGTTWRYRHSAESSAIMAGFDQGEHGRTGRIYVTGSGRAARAAGTGRAAGRSRALPRRAKQAAAGSGVLLLAGVALGPGLLLALGGVAVLAALGGWAVRRHLSAKPGNAALPSVAELRAMAPGDRQAALGAPPPPAPEPAPAPVPVRVRQYPRPAARPAAQPLPVRPAAPQTAQAPVPAVEPVPEPAAAPAWPEVPLRVPAGR